MDKQQQLAKFGTRRIVSIDPGVNLGLACLEVDLDTRAITGLEAHTCYLNSIVDNYHEELAAVHGMQMARMVAIEQIINAYCDGWLPDFHVHETAYSAHGRGHHSGSIESYAILRENILAIRLGFMRTEPSMRVYNVNPSTVKYTVVGVKSSDKDAVKNALMQKDDLDVSKINLDLLDQHAIDAIAIGYTFVHKRLFEELSRECSTHSNSPRRNKNKPAGR